MTIGSQIDRDVTGESESECPSIQRTRGNSDANIRSRDCEEKLVSYIVAIVLLFSYNYDNKVLQAYFGR